MKKTSKIKTGNLKNTILEMAPFALPLLDPDIASTPLSVVTRVLQSLGTYFITKFFSEFKERIKNKEIKYAKFATEKPALSFVELLRIIDKGEIDEELFRAIKSVFFSGIAKDANAQDEFWAYEFLQTAKRLSGTEILILKANFDIARGQTTDEVKKTYNLSNFPHRRSTWRGIVSLQMGYGELDSIVSKYESNLETLGLISRRQEDNRFSGDFEPTKKFRLTELGYKFCIFMTNYD